MPLLSSCPAKGSLFFFKPQRNSSGQTWLRQVKFEERIVEHPQIHQVATRLVPFVVVLFLARGPLDMLRYKMTKGSLESACALHGSGTSHTSRLASYPDYALGPAV